MLTNVLYKIEFYGDRIINYFLLVIIIMEYYDILHTIFGRDVVYYLMNFMATSNFHQLLRKYKINPNIFSKQLKKYKCVVAGSALLSCYHKFKVNHITVYGDKSYPLKKYEGRKIHPFVYWFIKKMEKTKMVEKVYLDDEVHTEEEDGNENIIKSTVTIGIRKLLYNVIELDKEKESRQYGVRDVKYFKMKFITSSINKTSLKKPIEPKLQRDWLVNYYCKLDICKIVYPSSAWDGRTNGDVVEPISGNIYDTIVKKQIHNNIEPTMRWGGPSTVEDFINDLHNRVMSMKRFMERLYSTSCYRETQLNRYHRRGFYIVFTIGDNKFIMGPANDD